MTYLSDRHLVVRHKGEISEKQNLPGGTGQGTRLGMFLFIVLVTNIGSKKDQITHQLGKVLTQKMSKREPIKAIHAKYLDDISFCSAVNLKSDLVYVDHKTLPVNYHQRTGHVLKDGHEAYLE